MQKSSQVNGQASQYDKIQAMQSELNMIFMDEDHMMSVPESMINTFAMLIESDAYQDLDKIDQSNIFRNLIGAGKCITIVHKHLFS